MFISVGREGIEPTLLIKERLFYRQLGLPSPIDPCYPEEAEAQGLRFSFSLPPTQVARQGIEPCLTVSKTVVRIHHTRKPCCFHQCPCQESNLIFDLRRVACVSTTLHRHFSKQWCRRDSNPQTLVPKTSRSAVGVPHHLIQATHTGFEPVISAVTEQHPLLAGPMGR